MTLTKTEKGLGITSLILLFIVIFQFVNRPVETTTTETKNIEVEIPAKTGSFSIPMSTEQLPSKGMDSVDYKSRIIVVASKADKETLEAYKKAAGDTIAQLKIVIDATREREYLYKFEDNNMSLSMIATSFGRVTNIVPKYEIKKTTVEVPQTTITKTITEPAKLKDVVSLNGRVGFVVGGTYQQDMMTRKPAYGVTTGIRIGKVTILGNINTNQQAGASALIEL